MEYYTLQIKLLDGCGISGKYEFEFKDIEFNPSNINKSMEIWQKGFKVQTAPGSFQLVSPFAISEAFILKQDKKYGL